MVIGSGLRRKSKQNRGMLVRSEVADKQVGGLEGVPRPEVELGVQLGGGRRVKSSRGKWDAADTRLTARSMGMDSTNNVGRYLFDDVLSSDSDGMECELACLCICVCFCFGVWNGQECASSQA